jgi:hypothetical protein
MPGSVNTQPPSDSTCQVYIGSCPTTGTQTSANQQPGQPGQGMTAGFPGLQPGLGAGGAGGGIGGGINSPGAQSNAASMINNLLTTPRPGGMPSAMPGSTVGGGIAGVASKYEAEGIMVVNDRTKINEWEFIFDTSKYRPPPNPLSGPAAMPQQQQMGTTPQQMGTTVNQMSGSPATPPPTNTPMGPGGGGPGQ